MSSILKALKKLEAGPAGPDERRIPETPGHGSTPPPEKKTGMRRLFMLLSIAVTAGVLICGAWIFFAGPPSFLDRSLSGEDQPPPGAAPAKAVRHPIPKAPGNPPEMPQKSRTPKAGVLAGDRLQGKPDPAKEGKKAAVPAASRPGTVEDPDPMEDNTAPVTVTGSDQLTIQALVWSDTPEKRFVVIDGQIIKEGGTVNGILVKGIGWDYVELKSGGKQWRLKQ